MATDLLTTSPTATVAGLFVAGLGAVYAYTHLGRLRPQDTLTPTPVQDEPGADGAHATRTTRKGKRRRRGKAIGTDDDGAEEEEGKGESGAIAGVVPGDFEGASSGTKVDAASDVGQDAPLVGTASKPSNGGRPGKKRNRKKHTKGGDGGKEVGSDTGREAGAERMAPRHGPRSGDSTDASVSLSPSLSVSGLASPRVTGKGNFRAGTKLAPLSQPHAQARLHAPSQPREIRSSLSLDTDSSWTHVGRRYLKSSDGQALVDPVDATSSDLASTASDSPVLGRRDSITTDMRGTRADPAHRTLAEKLVPKPRRTGVDDMLERPDYPTLARVMRVQPRADEAPVPGFSWDDYGDVVEDSLIVHDADQEDEGEWGIVKSRSRTRTTQGTNVASTSASTSSPLTPETMTKKQRQNARKRELAKAVKAEAEVARLEGLAKHKRDLERLRIIEQSQQSAGKRPGGGMQASVDDRGKLVWE